ncbi:YbaB/EbfC family nucleoid-associated protein [Spirillospora sp. CA-255316]
MTEFSSGEFDRMLSEARSALESLRTGRTDPSAAAAAASAASGDAGGEPAGGVAEGVGEAADGKVRVTAGPGGLLKSVELDPRALRLGSEELAEQVMAAVNAALTDLRSAAAGAAAAQAVDPAALTNALHELQDRSVRQMEMISQAFNDALSRLGDNRDNRPEGGR